MQPGDAGDAADVATEAMAATEVEPETRAKAGAELGDTSDADGDRATAAGAIVRRGRAIQWSGVP